MHEYIFIYLFILLSKVRIFIHNFRNSLLFHVTQKQKGGVFKTSLVLATQYFEPMQLFPLTQSSSVSFYSYKDILIEIKR